MKQIITKIIISIIFLSFISCSRKTVKILEKSTYQIQTINEIPHLPINYQGMTGTCWAFAMTSFLESEIIRKTKDTVDLSEMYMVRNAYIDKAFTHILRRGDMKFGEGALNSDALITASKYGLMPYESYSGLINGKKQHDHQKMFPKIDKLVNKYMNGELKGKQWKTEMNAYMDEEMGKVETNFVYQGKSYTPKSFSNFLGLNYNDYIHITSFDHIPFYQYSVLDMVENYSNVPFYNLPLDVYKNTIDNALEKGYTVVAELDVTEPTYSGEYGIAVIPKNIEDTKSILYENKPEKEITQELRQNEFENFATVNDHNQHIIGKVKDQYGKVYYKLKNSWENWGVGGYIYVSEAYLKLKVVYVTLHKDCLLSKN